MATPRVANPADQQRPDLARLNRPGSPFAKARGNPNWSKGVSANPGGRPKGWQEIERLAREKSTDAILTLDAISKNEDYPPNARVAAANSILDRGWGRPKQSVDLTTELNIPQLHLQALQELNNAAARTIQQLQPPEPKLINGEAIEDAEVLPDDPHSEPAAASNGLANGANPLAEAIEQTGQASDPFAAPAEPELPDPFKPVSPF